jgi:hypothetical protein
VGSGQHIFFQFDHYIVLIVSGTQRLVTTGKPAPSRVVDFDHQMAVLVLVFLGS